MTNQLQRQAEEAATRQQLFTQSLTLADFDYAESGFFELGDMTYTRLELKPGEKRNTYTRLLFENIRSQRAYAKSVSKAVGA